MIGLLVAESLLRLTDYLLEPTYVDAATQTYDSRDTQTQTDIAGSSLQTEELGPQLTEAHIEFRQLRKAERELMVKFEESIGSFDPANPEPFIKEHQSICSSLMSQVMVRSNRSKGFQNTLEGRSLESRDAEQQAQADALTKDYRGSVKRRCAVMAYGILLAAFEVEDKTAPPVTEKRRQIAEQKMEKSERILEQRGISLAFDKGQRTRLINGALRSRPGGFNMTPDVLEQCNNLWRQEKRDRPARL